MPKELRRAVELEGSNGKILGTEDYISAVNNTTCIGGYIAASGKSNYRDMLDYFKSNAEGYADNILDDMKENVEYLWLIDRDKRERLIEFLKGLRDFVKYCGGYGGYFDKSISFLNLSEYETRRKSNIWDSDIDRGINVIYNGGKSNISSSERVYLTEKAVKDGINWTAGNDEDKQEFFKEILNGNDESALIDIWHMYDYTYRKSRKLIGRNWRDIFSEDYIDYYEENIFQTKIRRDYLGYNSFEYESLFKDSFQKICDTINSDFDRGARGTHFVKVDNYERTEKLADELKRVDIDITYILLNLKRFKAEDVTEKLMGIFREAKREGERLKEKYPKAAKSSVEFGTVYVAIKGIKLAESALNTDLPRVFEEIIQTEKFINEFMDLVKSWGPYDIKRRFSWSQDLQYIFDGEIIDFDDTGNMAYGVLAKAAGLGDFALNGGAGVINALEAWESSNGLAEHLKTIEREVSWLITLCDDPRDFIAIRKGILVYYKL